MPQTPSKAALTKDEAKELDRRVGVWKNQLIGRELVKTVGKGAVSSSLRIIGAFCPSTKGPQMLSVALSVATHVVACAGEDSVPGARMICNITAHRFWVTETIPVSGGDLHCRSAAAGGGHCV